jgi:hypothetical protein
LLSERCFILVFFHVLELELLMLLLPKCFSSSLSFKVLLPESIQAPDALKRAFLPSRNWHYSPGLETVCQVCHGMAVLPGNRVQITAVC